MQEQPGCLFNCWQCEHNMCGGCIHCDPFQCGHGVDGPGCTDGSVVSANVTLSTTIFTLMITDVVHPFKVLFYVTCLFGFVFTALLWTIIPHQQFKNKCQRISNINGIQRFYWCERKQIEKLVNRCILLEISSFLTNYLKAFMIYFHKLLAFVNGNKTLTPESLHIVMDEFVANLEDFVKQMDRNTNNKTNTMLSKIFINNPLWKNLTFPSNQNTITHIEHFMQLFLKFQNDLLKSTISPLIPGSQHKQYNIAFIVNGQKKLTVKTGANIIFANGDGTSTVGQNTKRHKS